MNVLEKIYEDIEKAIEAYSKNRDMRFVVGADKMANKAKEIIISYMIEVEDMNGKGLIDASDDWIPVEERLPNQNGVYNVTRLIDDAFISDSAYFDGQDTWHNDNRVNHARPYLTDIVAWQPLPKQYKPKKQD